jgi:hypothetical protein
MYGTTFGSACINQHAYLQSTVSRSGNECVEKLKLQHIENWTVKWTYHLQDAEALVFGCLRRLGTKLW